MNEDHQQKHEMVLEMIHTSGAEEWYCPTCGRRFLMQWPPDYKKVVLEPGDEYAIHSAGKGGVSIQSAQVLEEEDELRLEVWQEWMEKVNFESLWTN